MFKKPIGFDSNNLDGSLGGGDDQSGNGGDAGNNNGGSNSKKQFFIETIAKFCDKCGTPYKEEDVQIVQESNFSSIIHFSCSSCKTNHIATFIKPMGVSSRAPVNTDLSVQEISRFAKEDKVSSDDVLDVYNILEEDQTIKSF